MQKERFMSILDLQRLAALGHEINNIVAVYDIQK